MLLFNIIHLNSKSDVFFKGVVTKTYLHISHTPPTLTPLPHAIVPHVESRNFPWLTAIPFRDYDNAIVIIVGRFSHP